MMPPGIFSASLASVSPTRRLSSSLSRTHGPAIRKSLSAGKNSATLFRRFYGRSLAASSGWRFALHGRGDEAREQWVGSRWPRLKLGVELAADEPGMGLQLDHFDQRAVWRQSAQIESVLDELISIFVVHLVAMAMAFAYLRSTVDGARLSARTEPAWIRAESHRSTHVGYVLLVFH